MRLGEHPRAVLIQQRIGQLALALRLLQRRWVAVRDTDQRKTGITHSLHVPPAHATSTDDCGSHVAVRALRYWGSITSSARRLLNMPVMHELVGQLDHPIVRWRDAHTGCLVCDRHRRSILRGAPPREISEP